LAVAFQTLTVLSDEHEMSSSCTSATSFTQSMCASKLASQVAFALPTFHRLMVESRDAVNSQAPLLAMASDSTPEQCCGPGGGTCMSPSSQPLAAAPRGERTARTWLWAESGRNISEALRSFLRCCCCIMMMAGSSGSP
jgi:hypothetical protein